MDDAPQRIQPLALVVDDDPEGRALLVRVAERGGFAVVTGVDGEEAVELARARRPDLILLDVEMPRRNGLEALEEIRETAPDVPVVVVTSGETSEVAEEALGLGAVNFVHKPLDERELRFVVERIRNVLAEEEDHRLTMPCLVARRTVLEIGNDTHLLAPVVSYLGRELRLHYPACGASTTEAKLALYEALANAIEHGNLEIDYDAKTRAMEEPGGIAALVARRREDPRFSGRHVRVEAEYGSTRVVWTIRDEGRGFSHRTEAAARKLGDTSALHGRGILLMKHYMDEVVWNERGNEVRLIREMRPHGGGAPA